MNRGSSLASRGFVVMAGAVLESGLALDVSTATNATQMLCNTAFAGGLFAASARPPVAANPFFFVFPCSFVV